MVTLCWPPVGLPPSTSGCTSDTLIRTVFHLAAARRSTPPGLGPTTVFSPQHQSFFCTHGPIPGAASLHTDRAATTTVQAAGQVRPVFRSGEPCGGGQERRWCLARCGLRVPLPPSPVRDGGGGGGGRWVPQKNIQTFM
jgi:hypothetical protein